MLLHLQMFLLCSSKISGLYKVKSSILVSNLDVHSAEVKSEYKLNLFEQAAKVNGEDVQMADGDDGTKVPAVEKPKRKAAAKIKVVQIMGKASYISV